MRIDDIVVFLLHSPDVGENLDTSFNLTPGGKSISGWSASDIAYYLESGFTPDFDSVGGSMVDVQKNMAKLTSGDRDAIAAYLKALPERANGWE